MRACCSKKTMLCPPAFHQSGVREHATVRACCRGTATWTTALGCYRSRAVQGDKARHRHNTARWALCRRSHRKETALMHHRKRLMVEVP